MKTPFLALLLCGASLISFQAGAVDGGTSNDGREVRAVIPMAVNGLSPDSSRGGPNSTKGEFCGNGICTAPESDTTCAADCGGGGGGGAVNGICGVANGGSSMSYPGGASACTSGNQNAVDAVGSDGTFNWTCNGIGSGTTATCSAVNTPDGTCGAANGSSQSAPPSGSIACATGTFQSIDSTGADGTYNWRCLGSPSGATATCAATYSPPVNGACGSANGTVTSSQPTGATACSAGTFADRPDTATNHLWSCEGTGGASTATCSSTIGAAGVAGVCGAANGSNQSVHPSGAAACSTGAFINDADTASNWIWSCAGTGGAPNATCAANRPVNASCGTSNGQVAGSQPVGSSACSAGTFADTADTGSNFNWGCTGVAGGSNATCQATRGAVVDGICGGGNNTASLTQPAGTSACVAGTFTDTADTASLWNWSCAGGSGGAASFCSAPKAGGTACGTVNGGSFHTVPVGTEACSSATPVYTDTDGADGTFNWTCGGLACSTAAVPLGCHDVALLDPPSPSGITTGIMLGRRHPPANAYGTSEFTRYPSRGMPGEMESVYGYSEVRANGQIVGAGGTPGDTTPRPVVNGPYYRLGLDNSLQECGDGFRVGTAGDGCKWLSQPGDSNDAGSDGGTYGSGNRFTEEAVTYTVDGTWRSSSGVSTRKQKMVACFTSSSPIAGRCGSAANRPMPAKPGFPTTRAFSLCEVGSVEAVDNTGSDGTYNWICRGPAFGDSATCQAPVGAFQTVNGQCGGQNGKPTYLVMPGLSACAAGHFYPQDTMGSDGTYNWSCEGTGGGTTTSCSAPRTGAQCGPANGTTTSARPAAAAACTGGGVNMTITPDTATTWNWSCNNNIAGIAGPSVACFSNKTPTAPPPPVINGTCGPAAGVRATSQPTGAQACSSGNFTDTGDGLFTYNWSCTGSGGGSTIACTANKF